MVGNQAVGVFERKTNKQQLFKSSFSGKIFGVPVYSFHTLWDWHHEWVESKTQQLVWWFHVKDSQSYHWAIVAVNSDFEHFKLYSWSHSHKQLWPMAQNCGWQKWAQHGLSTKNRYTWIFSIPNHFYSAEYLQGPQKSHWEWNHNSGDWEDLCSSSIHQHNTGQLHWFGKLPGQGWWSSRYKWTPKQ